MIDYFYKPYRIRRGKHCIHVIYNKICHMSKDFLFLMSNYKCFDFNAGTLP